MSFERTCASSSYSASSAFGLRKTDAPSASGDHERMRLQPMEKAGAAPSSFAEVRPSSPFGPAMSLMQEGVGAQVHSQSAAGFA